MLDPPKPTITDRRSFGGSLWRLSRLAQPNPDMGSGLPFATSTHFPAELISRAELLHPSDLLESKRR